MAVTEKYSNVQHKSLFPKLAFPFTYLKAGYIFLYFTAEYIVKAVIEKKSI